MNVKKNELAHTKAEGMDDADSPTTETEGSDFEGSNAEGEETPVNPPLLELFLLQILRRQ
jgi:hypothetical protein